MKSWTRRVVLPVVAAALCAVSGSAGATATPNGSEGLGAYVSLLQSLRTDLTDGSPEAKAIDAALKPFKDASTTYSEDINDFKIGVNKMRSVYGTDITDPDKGTVAKLVSDNVILCGMMVQVLGGRTYLGDLRGTMNFALAYGRAMKPKNDVARLAKLSALMRSVEAGARRKHINLNQGT